MAALPDTTLHHSQHLIATTAASHSQDGIPTPLPPNMIPRGVVIAGGAFLITISTFSILTNGYAVYLAAQNWVKIIKQSAKHNTDVLCLMLTIVDIVFALLVAFPAGIHMAWIDFYRKNGPWMIYHSKITGYVLFEYFFLLRVILIAVMTTERAVKFVRNNSKPPSRMGLHLIHKAIVDYWLIGLVLILPLISRALPNIVYLVQKQGGTHCKYYYAASRAGDNETIDYGVYMEDRLKSGIVPLTCTADGTRANAITELAVGSFFTVASWILITLSNSTILLITLKQGAYTSLAQASQQEKAKKRQRSLALYVVMISVTFSITNFPYVCIWIADYLQIYTRLYLEGPVESNPVIRFYLTLLIFLSLLFNPFLYLLKILKVKGVALSCAGLCSKALPTCELITCNRANETEAKV